MPAYRASMTISYALSEENKECINREFVDSYDHKYRFYKLKTNRIDQSSFPLSSRDARRILRSPSENRRSWLAAHPAGVDRRVRVFLL